MITVNSSLTFFRVGIVGTAGISPPNGMAEETLWEDVEWSLRVVLN